MIEKRFDVSDWVTEPLPVELVFAPSWWHKQLGLTFDEDFFYHPARRVEVEQQMERALYQRWGRFGLGLNHDRALPEVGAVHLAAGFLLSEMLGCTVNYKADAPPEVVPAGREDLRLDVESAFRSPAFRRFEQLMEALKQRHGGLVGDVNWGGVLNLALDLRGQAIFEDMFDRSEQAQEFFRGLGQVIERFVAGVEQQTGSSSISVNRSVRFLKKPIYLHSECSHTMISVKDYESFLMEQDVAWSQRHEGFGIHYCGADPHRYAAAFAKLPRLAFLDVGWGGDVRKLRQHLPGTFLNLRLSPVEILRQTPDEIRATVRRLAGEAANPWLTGFCCINMDANVTDDKVTAILEAAEQLRQASPAIQN